eukprot:TRINITY_DN4331_c0_g3_i1.p1 TRINITY_DN4331_c0_g3~~TRINITY_DN4331_c0_g3_i1.p1  ORF type:complete len:362 (+),score=83.75 TRINITY_DN4331_c0_g3_i1:81-1166(+)
MAEEGAEDIALADLDEAEEDEEADELLFFEDSAGTGNEAKASKAADAAAEASKAADAAAEVKEPTTNAATEPDLADEGGRAGEGEGLCTLCGLPGHTTANCPFAHAEDIDLGDIEESDSDDELAELYPIFTRYVSQHVGALTPKNKRGLTGGGRYFGDDKGEGACWACGQRGHDANDCPDKGCFFCSKKGHESRNCPQRSYRCSHCGLRGHAPVSCPTLASQQLTALTHVRCMRCGASGHPNCGKPPLAPAVDAAVVAAQVAHTAMMLQKLEGQAASGDSARSVKSPFAKSLPASPPALVRPPWAASGPRPFRPPPPQAGGAGKAAAPRPTVLKQPRAVAKRRVAPKAQPAGPLPEMMVCD